MNPSLKGPFLEGPEKVFAPGIKPPVVYKISNLMITELVCLPLLNMNTSTSPANYELLFGMPYGKDNDIFRKLNFCLLFANYYLHYHKVNEMNFDWVEFTSKMNYRNIENEVSGTSSFMMLLRIICSVDASLPKSYMGVI